MAGMAQVTISLATWKAIEAQRLSFDEDHDAIIRRALAVRTSANKQIARTVFLHIGSVQRKRGNMSVTVGDRITPVANLKAAYVEILTQLVKIRPGLFQSLLKEGSARRRWIALNPAELFPHSPHLAQQHAYQLARNWFIDTNLSRLQIETRCTRAAQIAGLSFGKDVQIAGA